MKFAVLKRQLLRHATKIPGWHTNRKIVVFESDDWGSIRMPSREIYDKIIKKGIDIDKNHYQKFDSLESVIDLNSLFEVLMKYRDKNGRRPVITANFITSNPDFERIGMSDFREYHSELFTETYKAYSGRENSFNLIKQGISEGIFYPQFHGKEHVNVQRWLKSLRLGNEFVRLAFNNKIYDLSTDDSELGDASFMDALRYEDEDQLNFVLINLTKGINQFEEIFGYRSMSFTAPRYTWTTEIESHLSKLGIRYLQGRAYQSIPRSNDINKYSNVINYTGKRNIYGQIYLTRNAFFEPSSSKKIEWTDKVLKEIATAFFWKKPAIICTHRVNFIGSIFEDNRVQNLSSLGMLLDILIKKYPEVEFMTSKDLGALIDL